MEKIEAPQLNEEKDPVSKDYDKLGQYLEWPANKDLWRGLTEEIYKLPLDQRKELFAKTEKNKYRNAWFNRIFGIFQFYEDEFPELNMQYQELRASFDDHQNKYKSIKDEQLKDNEEYYIERDALMKKVDRFTAAFREKLKEKLPE